MSKPIRVPYNENTKYIYETYIKIAREIAERNQRERNKLAIADCEMKDVGIV